MFHLVLIYLSNTTLNAIQTSISVAANRYQLYLDDRDEEEKNMHYVDILNIYEKK